MCKLISKVNEQRQEIKSDRMDMSFGEIINMYKEDEIQINPEYQRAFRWDTQRQTDFIESILLGIPFPSIFVATNDDGKWELIDGLQRISTVLSFFGELKDQEMNNLVLEEGGIIKELSGYKIETLPTELKLAIKRTPCRVEIIQKESNFRMRYELFKRLNTGGEGLTRQEIRNCVYRGLPAYKQFSDVIKELAKDDNFIYVTKISEEQSKKMLYEELVIRFFSLYYFLDDYKEKAIQDFFDNTMYKQCDKPDDDKIQEFKQKFKDTFSYIREIDKNEDVFRLSRLNFSTSAFDAIVITIAHHSGRLDQKNLDTFSEKVVQLKQNSNFKKYAGSASSNATNIREKIELAKKLLFEA